MAIIPTQNQYPDRAGYLGLDTDRNVLVGMSDGILQDMTNSTPDGWINVKDFGAKGDGVTDDTQAFQAAISSGKNIYVPDGTYVLTAELQLLSPQIILGNSWGKSKLQFQGCNGIRMVSRTKIIGLYLQGDNLTPPKGTGGTPGTIGIYLSGNPVNIEIRSSEITNFGETAIKLIDGMHIHLDDIEIRDNGANPGEGIQGASIIFHGSKPGFVPTTATIENIYITDGSEYAIYGDGGTKIYFNNLIIDYHQKLMHLETMYFVLFENLYFEANTSNDIEIDNSLVTFINSSVSDNMLVTSWVGTPSELEYVMNMSFPDFSGRDFKGRNFTVNGDLTVNNVPLTIHPLNYNPSFTFSNSNGSTLINGNLEQSVDTPVIQIPSNFKLFISIFIGYSSYINFAFLGYVQNNHLYNLDGTEFVSEKAYIQTPGSLGTYDLMLRCDDDVGYHRNFTVCLLGY